MWFDPLNLLLSAAVFIVYAAVCGIAILFSFFLDVYIKLNEKLNLEILTARTLTPLEQNIQWFDSWLMSRNKIIGPLLIILSVVDLKLFLDIINRL